MSYTFQRDGETYYYKPRYCPFLVTDTKGRDVSIPDSTFWFCRPEFLDCFEGEMETYQHLVDWLNENVTVLNDYGAFSFIRDMTDIVFYRYPEGDRTQKVFILRDDVYNLEPDDPLFHVVHTTRRSSGNRRLNPEFVLISDPDAPDEEEEKVRFLDLETFDDMRPVFLYVELTKSAIEQFFEEDDFAPFDEDEEEVTADSSYAYRVMNYTFTPELKFMSTEKEYVTCYFGMELEVSTMVSAKELQTIVTQVEPSQEIFFFMKDDTSIQGAYPHLYEIVTHPMTPKRMKREWNTLIKKIERLAEAKGKPMDQLFDMNMELNNGIHIHVGNDAFTRHNNNHGRRHPASTGRSGHKNRFLTAFNQWDSAFTDWLYRLSKRDLARKSWGTDYYKPHPSLDGLTVARRLRDGQRFDEHRCACHDNGRTTEVRVFYGSFDYKHICTCIEMVQVMLDFTRDAPISSYGRNFIPKFKSYVDRGRGFRNLKEALAQCV